MGGVSGAAWCVLLRLQKVNRMTRSTLKPTGLVAALTLAVSLGAMAAAQAGPSLSVTSPSASIYNRFFGVVGYTAKSTSTDPGGPAEIGSQRITSATINSGGETITFTNTGLNSPSGLYYGNPSNSSGQYATSPFSFSKSGNYSNYLAAEPAISGDSAPTAATSSVNIRFSRAQNGFDLLWGSVGSGNKLQFYNGSNLVDTVTGQTVASNSSLSLTSAPNAYVQISGLSAFTKVVATTPKVAFEFVPGPTLHDAPEPGSLLLLGTALLGLAGIRRVRRRA